MGKVGSTSLTHAIRSALPERPVFQVHHLSQGPLDAEEGANRRAFRQRRRIDGHLLNALYVRRALDRGDLPSSTAVITAVREPMDQRISAYLQTLPFRIPDLADQHDHESTDRLAARVLADFSDPDGWWHMDQIDRFLTHELQAVWGFDAMDQEFDRERGELVGHGRTHPCLVIRFEDLRTVAPGAVARFLDIDAVQIPVQKRSDDKFYGDVVRAVRSQIRFDDGYLDEVYSSRAVQHFYDQDEIERARARWSRRGW